MDESRVRYERKFYLPDTDRITAECWIRAHPALFSVLYPHRQVNNVYFDSINLNSYWDNVDGLGSRTKTRVRWYGSFEGRVEKPTLEIKMKEGMTGWKDNAVLDSFAMDSHFTAHTIIEASKRANIPPSLLHVLSTKTPVIANYYQRSYFQSADGAYRITLDSHVHHIPLHRQNNSLIQRTQQDGVILEIKYPQAQDDTIDEITNAFPFRVTKSSKYVNGVELLGLV